MKIEFNLTNFQFPEQGKRQSYGLSKSELAHVQFSSCHTVPRSWRSWKKTSTIILVAFLHLLPQNSRRLFLCSFGMMAHILNKQGFL